MKSDDDIIVDNINALRFKALELNKKCEELIKEISSYDNSDKKTESIRLTARMKLEARQLNEDADGMLGKLKTK